MYCKEYICNSNAIRFLVEINGNNFVAIINDRSFINVISENLANLPGMQIARSKTLLAIILGSGKKTLDKKV